MNTDFFSERFDAKKMFLGGVSVEELMGKHGVDQRDLNPYLPLDRTQLTAVGTEVHYLGYYIKWDPQECFYYCTEHTGLEANTERTQGSYSKYSSIDDQLDPLHYYMTLSKFGIARHHDTPDQKR